MLHLVVSGRNVPQQNFSLLCHIFVQVDRLIAVERARLKEQRDKELSEIERLIAKERGKTRGSRGTDDAQETNEKADMKGLEYNYIDIHKYGINASCDRICCFLRNSYDFVVLKLQLWLTHDLI